MPSLFRLASQAALRCWPDAFCGYAWGDAVEVIEPAALREMVHAHGQSDFRKLPGAAPPQCKW